MTVLPVQFRFAGVGLACAALHNIVMIALDGARVHYLAAAAVSYMLVVLTGYGLHTTVTFREPRSARSFLRYAVSMAANYPLTIGLLFAMCDVARLPVAVAAPSGTVLLFGWNFVASRWALRDPKVSSPQAEVANARVG